MKLFVLAAIALASCATPKCPKPHATDFPKDVPHDLEKCKEPK